MEKEISATLRLECLKLANAICGATFQNEVLPLATRFWEFVDTGRSAAAAEHAGAE